MTRNQKSKFRSIEKIYSPKRDSFKLAQKSQDNTSRRLASSSTCRSGSTTSVIGGKLKNILHFFKKPFYSLLRSKQSVKKENSKHSLEKTKNLENKYYSIPRLASSSTCRSGPEDKSISENINITRMSRIIKPNDSNIYSQIRASIRRFGLRLCLKKALALVTIIAVIGMTYWQNSQPVSAAAEAL